MKQELIAGIVMGVIGLSLLLIPVNTLWMVTEKWKSKGGEAPSKGYARLMRVLGAVFAAVGAVLIICGL